MLAGCSYQPTVQPPSRSWSEHQQQLMAYDQWQLQGKLGFKTVDRGGSATVHWNQNQQQYQVQLKAPLGAGNVVIEGISKRTVPFKERAIFIPASTLASIA